MAGEFELISEITADLALGADVRLGPGDDAAVLRPAGDVVVTTDVLIENVHFKRSWSSAHQIGRKAVAVNVSDVEAMGAIPSAVVIGLALPKDLDQAWVKEFQQGVAAECEQARVSLVGGDLSSSAHVAISVTALGNLDGRAPVTRVGARPGDRVAVCGRLGWAAGGLLVLQRGFGSPKDLVAEQQVPSVPYGQGRVAAEAGATAMIDVSDGLLQDLGHICERSGVGIDIDSSAFAVPDGLARVAAATGKNPMAFILAGGEDHALAATFPPDRDLPDGWRAIGLVGPGAQVSVDGEPWTSPTGWDHFA
ncbi:thiamine-phosphate kinase [Arachnia propionica]|uniref:Thiamine-monophosphate kinase n=1 Tax=Arachnia propionica TaxID=1750 RepID=A0A3P1T370_9ACTN|nr:thiamine-phosphate kinase [Arachnia propionica]MDO5083127.1 thiamine-phosphate kinase [Arachnia propionica]RRD03911.1 thiamine-phosphate kinase [Arachnia propionica]